MVKLNRIVKDYGESGAVNAFVNLFGFIDDQVFLTKSGEAGVVLKLQGRDYECLDPQELDHLTRRLRCGRCRPPPQGSSCGSGPFGPVAGPTPTC